MDDTWVWKIAFIFEFKEFLFFWQMSFWFTEEKWQIVTRIEKFGQPKMVRFYFRVYLLSSGLIAFLEGWGEDFLLPACYLFFILLFYFSFFFLCLFNFDILFSNHGVIPVIIVQQICVTIFVIFTEIIFIYRLWSYLTDCIWVNMVIS